jgi:hypothetical protein
VQISLNLKDNLTNRHPRGPPIKASLSLSHTHIVSARVHADVGGDAHVHDELHTTQALADGVLCDLELLRADAAVVVAHAQPVVAPDDGGAAHAAARGDAAAALSRFARFTGFRGEVVLLGGGGAEEAGAAGGKEGGGLAAGEALCDCCCWVHQYVFLEQEQLGGVRRGRAALRLSELKEARRLCGILGGGMAGNMCVMTGVRTSRSSMLAFTQVLCQGVAGGCCWLLWRI